MGTMFTNGRSFDLQLVPLATVADGAVQGFADGLLATPRVVGGAGRPSARWCTMLLHPSRPLGVAALVGADIAGVARFTRLTAAGRELYLAVAAPYRRLGVGSELLAAAEAVAAERGEAAILMADAPRRAVRSLADRFRPQPFDTTVAGLLTRQSRVA